MTNDLPQRLAFAILEHDHPHLHWDFFLETPTALRSWRLERMPDCAGVVNADALSDHRKAYLDYEGPVSGDRGSVSRIDRGEFDLISSTEHEVTVRLHGQRLRGIARLTKSLDASVRWTFEWQPDEIAA